MKKENTHTRDKDYSIPFIAAIALIGISLLLFSTKWGVGLSPDSATYIEGARNLLKGLGYSSLSGSGTPTPITRQLPLFSASLSIIGFFGIDPLDGARWFNAFLFGANIFLVGFLINRNTHSAHISIFGAFLMLTSIDMLKIHSMAWTEPLFILFCFKSIILRIHYLTSIKENSMVYKP